jgi:hypothetical protein
MTIKKIKKVEYFVNVCKQCGKEFEVCEGSSSKICIRCVSNNVETRATEQVQSLIGAVITDIELTGRGLGANPHQIGKISVRTKGEEEITFEAGGYDEIFIGY